MYLLIALIEPLRIFQILHFAPLYHCPSVTVTLFYGQLDLNWLYIWEGGVQYSARGKGAD